MPVPIRALIVHTVVLLIRAMTISSTRITGRVKALEVRRVCQVLALYCNKITQHEGKSYHSLQHYKYQV